MLDRGDYQFLVDFPTRKEDPSRVLGQCRVRVEGHHGASEAPRVPRSDSSAAPLQAGLASCLGSGGLPSRAPLGSRRQRQTDRLKTLQVLQTPFFAMKEALQELPEVVQQVPLVGYLHSFRSPLSNCPSVFSRTVAPGSLDSRMGFKPSFQSVGCPIGKHVHPIFDTPSLGVATFGELPADCTCHCIINCNLLALRMSSRGTDCPKGVRTVDYSRRHRTRKQWDGTNAAYRCAKTYNDCTIIMANI